MKVKIMQLTQYSMHSGLPYAPVIGQVYECDWDDMCTEDEKDAVEINGYSIGFKDFEIVEE